MNLKRMYKQRLRYRCRSVLDAKTYRKAMVIDESDALRIMEDYTDAIKVAIRKTLGEDAYNLMVKQLM